MSSCAAQSAVISGNDVYDFVTGSPTSPIARKWSVSSGLGARAVRKWRTDDAAHVEAHSSTE